MLPLFATFFPTRHSVNRMIVVQRPNKKNTNQCKQNTLHRFNQYAHMMQVLREYTMPLSHLLLISAMHITKKTELDSFSLWQQFPFRSASRLIASFYLTKYVTSCVCMLLVLTLEFHCIIIEDKREKKIDINDNCSSIRHGIRCEKIQFTYRMVQHIDSNI